MKYLPLILLALAVGCSSTNIGSATTRRPALSRPAIEPDGAFWDAVTVARQGDSEAFLYLLSPQMKYRALFPEGKLDEITTQKEFEDQRKKIDTELEPYAAVVQEFAARYMTELAKLITDKFIEVGRPKYEIIYKDEYDRASGPNTAKVIVNVYPKQGIGEDFKPEVIEVSFIQDGRRWLINGFTNDKLKGAFVR